METPDTKDASKKASLFKRILAGILDFLTVFVAAGWAIAELTGNTTENGFQLNGIPALILFAIIIAYFVIGRKYLGGTLWQRLLGTRS